MKIGHLLPFATLKSLTANINIKMKNPRLLLYRLHAVIMWLLFASDTFLLIFLAPDYFAASTTQFPFEDLKLIPQKSKAHQVKNNILSRLFCLVQTNRSSLKQASHIKRTRGAAQQQTAHNISN
jgi:hypothetical protein